MQASVHYDNTGVKQGVAKYLSYYPVRPSHQIIQDLIIRCAYMCLPVYGYHGNAVSV